jgi:hypothetical protein
MSDCLSRNKLFDIIKLGMFCLMLPACQQTGEPITSTPPIDPKIAWTEPPPKPLPDDLVVTDPLPFRMQNTLISIPNVKVEDVSSKLASQAPTIPESSLVQPVSHPPKRSGMSVALEAFLDHRTDDAIAALKEYSTDDQDIALVLLPMLARIQQGETWPTLDGPQKMANLESLRSLTKRLSKSAPLVLQHVAFVDEPPIRFGEIKPRTSLSYYPQDAVCVYAEMVNLVDYPNADEDYSVRLDISFELVGANGTVFWKKSKPFDKQISITSRNDFHVTARFDLINNLAPGSYQLVIQVLDRDSNRTARKTLPLQILDSRTKTNGPAKRKG